MHPAKRKQLQKRKTADSERTPTRTPAKKKAAKRPASTSKAPDGTTRPGTTRGLASRITATERQRQAVDLRLQGLSYQQVGDELGIGKQEAYNLVSRALKQNRKELAESVEDVREMELAKLDKLDRKLWELLDQGGGELVTTEEGIGAQGPISKVRVQRPGIGGVIDRLLAVQKRRADILGLDSASKHEVTGPEGGPIQLTDIARIVKRGDEAARIAAGT